MSDLFAAGATLERIASGTRWGEGPVWLPRTARVRWSDVPADRILEWDAATGATEVVDAHAEYANGRTLDLEGRVVQCSHGRRRVEREVDGRLEPVAERWAGGRLNSPNDVIVASDGAVWFTDPPYGIHPSGAEGHPAESEYGASYVFRVDPLTGAVEPVVTDMTHPNGLALSPDESLLYVAETGSLQVPGTPREVRVYPVLDGRRTGAGRALFAVANGLTDGMRVDVAGRIWSSSADGVEVLAPDGTRIAHLPVPERVANLCFGGPDGDELFIAASTSLYRIRTTTTDAARRA